MATTTTTPATTSPAPAAPTRAATSTTHTSSRRGRFDALRDVFRADGSERTGLRRRSASYPPSRSAATLFLPYE